VLGFRAVALDMALPSAWVIARMAEGNIPAARHARVRLRRCGMVGVGVGDALERAGEFDA
jgi:hypothetical protein